MPLCYGIGGMINTPQGAIKGNGVPSSNLKGDLGQQYFDFSTSPPSEYTYNGSTWESGGNSLATTTEAGIVLLYETDSFSGADDSTVPTSLTVKTYVDSVAIAGSPVATETTAGIGELATDAEAVAGTPSTGALALFVTPSNLTPVFAAPPALGGTTAAAATFTDLTADGTGAVSLGSNAAADFTVASGDLTLEATTGSVIVNGEEAVDDAIQLTSAAGGLAASVALSAVIASSETNADSVQVTSAGGMDITATGAAGKDIDIVCTSGSININAGENIATSMVLTNKGLDINTTGAAGQDIDITNTGGSINIIATENNSGAIIVQANGGASERVTLLSSQGTGADSINLESTAGGITLDGALATADAINIVASDAAGGIDIDAGTGGIAVDSSGAIVLTDTKNAANAIYLHANGGTSETIKIHSDQGTGVASIEIASDVGGLTLSSGLASADAINIVASDAAGGIDIDCGSAGFIVDAAAGAISLDSALASNFTVTGAADLTLQSTAGSVIVSASEDVADALQLLSTAGGIDILATGEAGQDIDIVNTGGSVNITATEDVANAIYIRANGGTSETVKIHADQGTGVASIEVASDVGGVTISSGLASADAINIVASNAAGGIDIDCGSAGFIVDAAAGAISLDSALASNFTVTGAADLTLQSTAGAVNIISGEANADSLNMTSAGGISMVATGAAAKDVIVTNTNGSMTLTAGESVSDAMNFTASGAASGMTLTAGTAGISFVSGQKMNVTDVAAAATPYTVLGTDYYINTDTTGGVLTLTLPASPATGRQIVVYDGVGQAGANAVTVNGNGKSIALAGTSAGTKTLTTAYSSMIITYNGTLWAGQAIA